MQDRRGGIRYNGVESISANIVEKKWMGMKSEKCSAKLLDLSSNGARIEFHKEIDVGSVVGLHVFVPGVIDEVFDVLVKFNQFAKTQCLIGVEFLAPNSNKELKDLLLRISGNVTG